jgi:hypothetical protein
MVVALGYSETHGENGERDVDAPEEEPLERAVFVESVEDTIARQPRGKYRSIATKLRDREKWGTRIQPISSRSATTRNITTVNGIFQRLIPNYSK